MTVYNWDDNSLDSFSQTSFFKEGTGISIGSFDGLHLGHRFLLEKLVEIKDRAGLFEQPLSPGIITFSRPLPAYKHSDDYTGDISTLSQRLRFFEEAGIEFVFVVDFTEAFASLKGIDFLDLLRKKLNMKFLAEGIDFRCGYKGATDTQAIKYWAEQNEIDYCFVDPVFYTEADGAQERISSSYIRHMIQKGFFTTIGELLNRPYELDIEEIRRNGQCVQVLPPDGFYNCKTETDEIVRIQIDGNKLAALPECKRIVF